MNKYFVTPKAQAIKISFKSAKKMRERIPFLPYTVFPLPFGVFLPSFFLFLFAVGRLLRCFGVFPVVVGVFSPILGGSGRRSDEDAGYLLQLKRS